MYMVGALIGYAGALQSPNAVQIRDKDREIYFFKELALISSVVTVQYANDVWAITPKGECWNGTPKETDIIVEGAF